MKPDHELDVTIFTETFVCVGQGVVMVETTLLVF